MPSMGPVGSPLAEAGVQLTDSPYVVSSLRIMGRAVLDLLQRKFVKSLHSGGQPTARVRHAHWPSDPERTVILHRPADNEIVSYGSG